MAQKRFQLENLGSLITIRDANCCLGYLFKHEGEVFDATLGLVPVNELDADTHNKLFDEIVLKGLDDQCEVGQGNYFYLRGGMITTWLGTVVNEKLRITNHTVEMERKGRKFVGRRPRKGDGIFMQRKT